MNRFGQTGQHGRGAALLALLLGSSAIAAPLEWKSLRPGLELASFAGPANPIGDGQITVLRADLSRFQLALLSAKAGDGNPRTARDWSAKSGAVAAINASMFQTDQLTSVGLMRSGAALNNPALDPKYKSLFLFAPLDAGLPEAQLVDLEGKALPAIASRYAGAIQNLRMIDGAGKNRWGASRKKWSTAAIGLDRRGRVLLIHCRSPYPVQALADALLAAPLELKGAMYVEGGPEAQLYVHANPDDERELIGSYETGFHEADDNRAAWPIPNVLALMPIEDKPASPKHASPDH